VAQGLLAGSAIDVALSHYCDARGDYAGNEL
jgi:hypothetical protein